MDNDITAILAALEKGEISPAEAETQIKQSKTGGQAASKTVEESPQQSDRSNGGSEKAYTFGFGKPTKPRFDIGKLGRQVSDAVHNLGGKPTDEELSPSQQRAYDFFVGALPIGSLFVLWTRDGLGRSMILRALHNRFGGGFVMAKDFAHAMRDRHPYAMEETYEKLLMKALESNEIVFVDDFHLLNDVVCCGHFYQRNGYLNGALTSIASYVQSSGKKLIVGCRDGGPRPISRRSYAYGFNEFEIADYGFLCRAYLKPAQADQIDFAKVHRFAPKLSAHQLKGACVWLNREADLDTDKFIEYLRSQHMTSNVSLGEVQEVDIHDLKGIDDIIESLEANIIVPLENDALAAEFNIKPKRGVLLAGPPGTGKTTIGRALAHRLKSKFFLIDGTFISGTRDFYSQVYQVVEMAKQNAPSILFIDDSDVIFESGEEMGLYRYLLTILDGLESESAGRVCVMMTAMDVANLPPALIRSGRIELWLETRLPDAAARESILNDQLAFAPSAFADIDRDRLVEASEEFTGADIKRLVEDGKVLYAFDKSRGIALKEPTEYFLTAVEGVRANRERYAEAEARARQNRQSRPPWFDMMGSAMAAYQGFEEDD